MTDPRTTTPPRQTFAELVAARHAAAAEAARKTSVLQSLATSLDKKLPATRAAAITEKLTTATAEADQLANRTESEIAAAAIDAARNEDGIIYGVRGHRLTIVGPEDKLTPGALRLMRGASPALVKELKRQRAGDTKLYVMGEDADIKPVEAPEAKKKPRRDRRGELAEWAMGGEG